MFRNLVLSAAGAGLAACLAVAVLQSFTTEPLILHAEVYEKAGEAAGEGGHDVSAMPIAPLPAVPHARGEGAWQPADGIERALATMLADLLVGVAVSLMLLGVMVAKGGPIDGGRGLLWGAAGFVAASLLPSLGLPPELPGTPAGDLLSRQSWWLGTALASGVGLFLLAFGRHSAFRVAGLALLVLPHVIGAPEPPSHEAAYPAGLAGEFAVASLVVSAVLWSFSGLASGWLYARLSRRG